MRDHKMVIEGVLQDEHVTYTIVQISEICVVEKDIVDQMLEFGIIEPREQSPQEFDYFALQRAQKALRLRRDLEINWQGLSLVLDLLDEIQDLRQKVELYHR